jgi:hypothetical protein
MEHELCCQELEYACVCPRDAEIQELSDVFALPAINGVNEYRRWSRYDDIAETVNLVSDDTAGVYG